MKRNKKLIIGLVGESGSGKDTVANYLKGKYNAKLFRFSDPLRDALELYLDSISREEMSWLAVVFRKRFGNNILSRGLRKKIEKFNNREIIAINGIRYFEDFEFIKSLPNSFVLYITLDSKKRWERIYSRGEKTDDAVNYEKFRDMEMAETEVNIPKIGEKADYRIENTGTKEELFAKVDEIIKGIT